MQFSRKKCPGAPPEKKKGFRAPGIRGVFDDMGPSTMGKKTRKKQPTEEEVKRGKGPSTQGIEVTPDKKKETRSANESGRRPGAERPGRAKSLGKKDCRWFN